jgi:hypothetical protein
VSDIYDRGVLLAAAPIQARWDNAPEIPWTAAPCLEPLAGRLPLPLFEGL